MVSHPLLLPLPAELVARVRAGLLTLLPGEARVLCETLQGYSAREIANVLKISPRTVETQMARVTAKCGCRSAQLLRICCYDLAHDRDILDVVGLRAAMYPANVGNRKIAGYGVA